MNNLKTLNEKIKFYTPQLKRRRNKNAEESCDDFRCKDYTHINLGNHLETLSQQGIRREKNHNDTTHEEQGRTRTK